MLARNIDFLSSFKYTSMFCIPDQSVQSIFYIENTSSEKIKDNASIVMAILEHNKVVESQGSFTFYLLLTLIRRRYF